MDGSLSHSLREDRWLDVVSQHTRAHEQGASRVCLSNAREQEKDRDQSKKPIKVLVLVLLLMIEMMFESAAAAAAAAAARARRQEARGTETRQQRRRETAAKRESETKNRSQHERKPETHHPSLIFARIDHSTRDSLRLIALCRAFLLFHERLSESSIASCFAAASFRSSSPPLRCCCTASFDRAASCSWPRVVWRPPTSPPRAAARPLKDVPR